MNLLIVEDSEQMRRTIKTFVRDLASEIHECADGAEALAAYRAHRPDWVLMDIRVGRMDGITATRQIKAADATARIVIVTNYDDADLRALASTAGACAYVVKENLFVLRQLLSQPPPVMH
jgi:CheY-like chemotaxis protein